MFRNACQHGLLTIFFTKGPKPFLIWEITARGGYVTVFLDQDIKSMVAEIRGNNVSTTYMECPKGRQVLGITMPILVMIVKNLHKYFSFEVTVKDETGTRRRFRVSNFQSSTQILPLCTVMPLCLANGWNQIQFNLAEFCRRAYQKQFVEVQKVKINCNIRIRRIYFTEKILTEEELPKDYKLFFPLPSKGARRKSHEKDKENVAPSQSLAKAPSLTQKQPEAKKMVDQAVSTDPPPDAAPTPAPEAPPAEAPATEGEAKVEEKVEKTEGAEEQKEVVEGQEGAVQAAGEGEPKPEGQPTETGPAEGQPAEGETAPEAQAAEAPAGEAQPAGEPPSEAAEASKEPEAPAETAETG